MVAILLCVAIPASAEAAYRQATGVSQNSVPDLLSNSVCTGDYTILADGIVSGLPGFCPITGQTNYAVTLSYDVSQAEFASRLVIWANAGVIYTDGELRTFDLTVTYLNPVDLTLQTYTKIDAQVADTIDDSTPVYFDFVDANGNPIKLYGIKTVTMKNLRNVPVGGSTEAPFREVQVDVSNDPAATLLTVAKSARVFDETVNPKFYIPQNDIIYTVEVTNLGTSGIDASSIFLADALPSKVTFFNGDANGSGAGSASVVITDSASGLSFPASAVGYATVAPASFSACNYQPSAGYDPNVRYICIEPSGIMLGASGPTHPSFKTEFRAQIH